MKSQYTFIVLLVVLCCCMSGALNIGILSGAVEAAPWAEWKVLHGETQLFEVTFTVSAQEREFLFECGEGNWSGEVEIIRGTQSIYKMALKGGGGAKIFVAKDYGKYSIIIRNDAASHDVSKGIIHIQ